MTIDCSVPRWLVIMRAITGLTETSGSGSNPKIMAMRDWIACTYANVDGMVDYCELYTGDDVAWCGLTSAFCVTVAGVMPPFKKGYDTNCFLWALAWSEDQGYEVLDEPILGCIVVLEREGGGHVTFYESTDGDSYMCRGGNQSDCVNVAPQAISNVVALVWPRGMPKPGPLPPHPIRPDRVPIEGRPTLAYGDAGTDVLDMQRMIPRFNGVFDGDFGSTTEENLVDYQRSRGLEDDGVCGPQTWEALYRHMLPIAPPPPPPGALTIEQQSAVMRIANESDIADYSWDDRGYAPTGFTQGMALAFAQSYKKLQADHPAVMEMAKARTNSDKDALNLYKADFTALGMSNEKAGADTLRHLYALMLGQGMRESSGQHCCGRDQSADNYDSDTCEAGAFQTSYNAAGASDPEFDDLMDEYSAGLSPGYLEAFSEDVSCSSSDWDSYGSGRGREFQDLCKNEPAFSVESCGLTLRNLCNHYGPIVRHETELQADAERMFKAVQEYMDAQDAVA